jgi:hypothetical protein
MPHHVMWHLFFFCHAWKGRAGLFMSWWGSQVRGGALTRKGLVGMHPSLATAAAAEIMWIPTQQVGVGAYSYLSIYQVQGSGGSNMCLP